MAQGSGLNRLSTWLPGLLLLALIPHVSVGQYQEWEQDRGPDSEGLWRDTRYFLGYQVAAIGILYAMPESVTGWTDEQKHNYSLSVWWDNVTSPSCDSDDFFINYVTHPYWGAAYYMRAHERGYDRKAAFWYSVLLSTTYEFGVEALFEEPSIQDLVVTPVFGSLLGGYFVEVRETILEEAAARGHRTTKDKWVLVLTDPLGALNRSVRKTLGRDTDLELYPYYASYEHELVVGLRFELTW